MKKTATRTKRSLSLTLPLIRSFSSSDSKNKESISEEIVKKKDQSGILSRLKKYLAKSKEYEGAELESTDEQNNKFQLYVIVCLFDLFFETIFEP